MSTCERAAGVDVERLIPRDEDPPAPTDADTVYIYVRPVDGVQRTCARFPNGTVKVIL